MIFSGIPFLFYFLPVTLIVYAAAPRCLKNAVLMICSLFFYAWGEPGTVVWMLAAILTGYASGILMEYVKGTAGRRLLLAVSLIMIVGLLVYFKYTDFFIGTFNEITKRSIPLIGIALPVGISFYTFQIISYVVDVYRKDVPAQKNPINLAAYVAMFPQLIAGPIVRYSDIEKQLNNRTHDMAHITGGITRFTLGLGKKILIANSLGELCDIFRNSNDRSVMFFWLYAVAFTLHIYFDFSGYSDMAIGLGRMFGFDFTENFNYPYIAKSITEFWRRWHISLGSWFRDYIYIPLGGNRVSKLRWVCNIMVVWMLTGFWHGAAWNFILWGLFYGVLLLLEKFVYGKWLEKHQTAGHIYTLLMVVIGFVLFNAVSAGEALEYIQSMLGLGDVPLVSEEFFYYLRSYGVTLILGITGATPLVKKCYERIAENETAGKVLDIVSPFALAMLFLIMTSYLVDGSFNPFLYFRF